MLIPLKRKYRPDDKPLILVAGMSEVPVRSSNDYFAKKIDSGSNHQGNKAKAKIGPKTYDKTKHVLWIYPNGKRRMVRR